MSLYFTGCDLQLMTNLLNFSVKILFFVLFFLFFYIIFITLLFKNMLHENVTGPQIKAQRIVPCREGNVKKRTCFEGQLKVLHNQLSAGHYCLVGQEQKAAWGNATGTAGPQPVRIGAALSSDFAELLSSTTSMAGAVTLCKVRGIGQKLSSGEVLNHYSCRLPA